MSRTPGMFPSGAGSDRFNRIRTNNNNSIRGNAGAGISNNMGLRSGTIFNSHNSQGGSSFTREEVNDNLQSNRGNDPENDPVNDPVNDPITPTTTANINNEESPFNYTFIIISCLLVVLGSFFIYKIYYNKNKKIEGDIFKE